MLEWEHKSEIYICSIIGGWILLTGLNIDEWRNPDDCVYE